MASLFRLWNEQSISRLVRVLILATVALFLCGFQATAIALGLSDNRAYELISPVQKSGGAGGVFPLGELALDGGSIQSSSTGSSVAYSGEDFFEPHLGSVNTYFSAFGNTGWMTSNLTPAVPSTTESAIDANTYVGFAPDLSVGVISTNVPLTIDPAVPARYANLYIANGPGLHDLQAVITANPPNRSRFQFGWAHSNPSGGETLHNQLFFGGGNAGTETVPAYSHILFSANDALTPNASDGGRFADNLYEWDEGQLRLVNVLPNGTTTLNASFGADHNDEFINNPLPNLSRVVSSDGSRIFWTDQNSGGIYVREDGERTKQIDAAVGGNGEYQTASSDGSRVFFTKEAHLYEYRTETEATTDLTPIGGVGGVLGASEDGTSIYFVATSVMRAGAAQGQPNLYLDREGTLRFVVTLSPEDNQAPELYGSGEDPGGDWYRTFAGRTAAVSPSGEYAAFISIRGLTGYDNTDAVFRRRDYEAYVYDSSTGAVTCASCNVDGSRPTASTLLPEPADGFYQQRYLDNAGQLFFSTTDPVVPQDTNGLSDVYEYENAHTDLISPGDAGGEAFFADASESGNDLFFTTDQSLAPDDQDQITDLYNARIGGRAEAPPPPACTNEECLATPVAPSVTEAPISAAFSGAGDITIPASTGISTAKKPAIKKRPTLKRVKHKRHSVRHRGHAGRTLR
jgi:hypothetical protein